MERKFRYGIWKMPEWNGMENFKNWNGRQSSILPSMGVDLLLIKQIPKGKMSLRSLVKLKYSISVRNFAPKLRCRPIKKKGLRRKLVRFQPRISEFCPQIQVNTKPKRSSPHSGSISVRNFGSLVAKWVLLAKKPRGQTYFAPFSVRPEEASPPRLPEINASASIPIPC